ncbi:hypothetical protein L1987_38012 [Smallanthus sonchifolius]|uniref:Uncharacterized protein n=1 Tax=Smallanthus sonchifolius TaxID=185202 RepID=A0ACB9HI07_9ASTR|nr:hypothetical protein L1987_38012 [Smallanthus sonchifolius]
MSQSLIGFGIHGEEEEKKLSDVWNRFDEWSACGAGFPVNVGAGDHEPVVQYYVPYLSAVQIFTSGSTLNYLREETYSETRDSFSDSLSDDSESEKLSRWDGCSSDEGVFDQDSPSHCNDRLDYLYFQYFERSTPYERVPLLDKYLYMKAYKIHVNLDADVTYDEYHNEISKKKNEEKEGIHLRAFGMATHKMQGNMWISGGNGKNQEKLVSLLNVAGCWLKQLNVQHHDFNYFMGYRHG